MRAVVAGAGIAGLTAAWWLRRSGWDVVVAERRAGPSTAGYVIDFFGPGHEVARRMGLLPRLETVRAPIRTVQYLDVQGRGRGRIDYRAVSRAVDDRVMTLGRGDLAAALLDAVRDDVDLRWGAAVAGAHDDGSDVHVQLADGATVTADLLVGADGLHSRVRAALVAPGADVIRPLGYHTAAFRLEDDALLERLRGRAVMVVEPGRQVTAYPTADGAAAAWFLAATGDDLPADRPGALRRTFGGMSAQVDRLLRHCPGGGELYYDLVAQTEVDRWTTGRTVLIGDACHAPSLMAGQGASMAMAGAWALAEHLRRSDDVPSGLRAYVTAMRPFAEERQVRGRRAARWLLPSSWAGITARQAFFAVSRQPWSAPLVRRAFGADAATALPG